MAFVSVAGAADSFALGETSRDEYVITDGVTESTVYVTVDGGYNVRAHIVRAASGAVVDFRASYGAYYSKDSDAASRKRKARKWSENDWTNVTVKKQAAAFEAADDTDGEVIAASNGDYFELSNGEPKGNLVMEGNIIRNNRKTPYFAVLKNGRTVIRKAGTALDNVREALSGDEIILWNGKISFKAENSRKPRVAIGTCDDGTVVIVNVDGREPGSAGITREETAQIMKAQGCTRALNLDGGGSASLLTQRSGEEKLTFRSNRSDGAERRVGSALLVIKKKITGAKSVTMADAGAAVTTADMTNSKTSLSMDGSGVYHYLINGKKQTGLFSIDGKPYLFSRGIGLTKEIKIGNVTYKFEKGALTEASDKESGNVVIGYFGAAGSAGDNIIYAYHEGDKRLIIGRNPLSKSKSGRMRNLTGSAIVEMPWYSVRADIRTVYVGDGVRNLGNYFLYSTKGKMTGGTAAPKCMLRSIRLPVSLTKIGAYALYNKPQLTHVVIPFKVSSVGRYAFAYSGHGSIRFLKSKAPAFGRSAFEKTGFACAYVRKTSSWKTFVHKKKFRKYGFKKSVRYK